ncbi:Phosphopantetheine attachment site [Domibacillus enclensis]|uniref:Phosphopantetheine attachment site n=1 Tax=Domibacillus enclensis TaxID=1017273 RepID=A0A1N6SD93_9BACI|nr:Phosphopantetheine attachment site [Domibacillus enclensis]
MCKGVVKLNEQKLKLIFSEALEIDPEIINDELAYNSIAEWDSIAHMALVAEIDDQFDIMLDTDDVLDMSSFSKAKEILTKYDITFE